MSEGDGPQLERADRFVMIPEALLDPDVHHSAVVLFGVLWTYSDYQRRTAWPSRRTLADRLGVSVDTIDRLMKVLVGVGAVTITERVSKSNLYRLHLTPGAVSPDSGGRTRAAGGSRTRAALTKNQQTKKEQDQDPPADAASGAVAVVRVKTAAAAVTRIGERLASHQDAGGNAWNLTDLVAAEWDGLYAARDVGGCIALTAWYCSEMLGRSLPSRDIGRIGQIVKRYGRIGHLALDQACVNDPDDLVSYANRVAASLYAESKGATS